MAILNESIKDKLNEYFITNWGAYPYRRGWMRADCPSCGAHKYGVNLTLNRTNCFRCGYNPQPIQVVMDLENIDTKLLAFKYIKGLDGVEYYKAPIEVRELKESTSLPDNYKNIKRGKSIYSKKARNYLRKRGFDINELSEKGFGYCTKGKYWGYIIIPFYHQGKLIYFNAREFMGKGSKFNNPLVEDFGLGKSMLMYNTDALYLYKKCYIFESVTNCLTVGEEAVAIGGKKLSRYQLNTIIKAPCEKIVIGLDMDGFNDAIEVALKLYQHKKVKIMKFSDSRDINDLGKKKSKEIEIKAKYLKYGEILKLKTELCRGSLAFI